MAAPARALVPVGAAAIVAASMGSAAAAGPERFALLVAHDQGGEGQAALSFSDADAERLAAVLTELGDFAPDAVSTLRNPTGSDLESGLDWLQRETEAARRRGAEPLAVFYYSGHARSAALSLGREAFDIDRLRARLEALPAAVKLVILDACQSGSFSSVKGAAPAPEFAVSSAQRLDVEGLAVLASSTGSELSQESDDVGGSFFTHHLVSGLWGPADDDDDGRISIEEAYRYAYHRTVISTAATRVGRQHPTLEMDVRGHGSLVLTQPRKARSALSIPAGGAESVLIATSKGRVWAEIELSRTQGLDVPLPAGDYVVVLRDAELVQRCAAQVADGRRSELDSSSCTEVEAGSALPKADPPRRWWRDLGFELAVGLSSTNASDYVVTLFGFGYTESSDVGLGHYLRYVATGGLRIHRNFEVLFAFERLEKGNYERRATSGTTYVSWDAHATSLIARGLVPLFGGWFVPYVQAGGGVGWARALVADDVDHHVGWTLGAAGGLRVMLGQHVGLYSQIDYTVAPLIENRLGEVHDSGGTTVLVGLRVEL